jgi:hypothetical protein
MTHHAARRTVPPLLATAAVLIAGYYDSVAASCGLQAGIGLQGSKRMRIQK